MSGLEIASGVIAVIQLTDNIISFTTKYIEAVRSTPRDLYIIRIETLSLKASLESIRYLHESNDPDLVQDTESLIAGCTRTLADLESLFRSSSFSLDGADADPDPPDANQPRIQRIQHAWNALAWPKKAKKARSLLDEIMRYKTSISLALLRISRRDLQDVTNEVQHLSSILSSGHNKLRSKPAAELLQWIAPLKVLYRDAHQSALNKRFGSTGSWLLQSAEYRQWYRSRAGFLVLDGLAGAGKSVLSSAVVQDLSQRAELDGSVVLYFYFSMKDATRNYLAAFYDTLVRQILQHCQIGYADVADLANSLNWGHPSREDYIELCKKLLRRIGRAVYLVVDGVDSVECRELHLLLDFLDKLMSPPLAGSTQGLRLLITTRYLSNLQGQLLHPDFHVQLTQKLVEPDVRAFVEGHIYGMDEESRNAMGQDLQRDAVRRIVEASDGLFVQAAMHVERVTNLCTVEDVEEAIGSLSSGLYGTYRRILLDVLATYSEPKDQVILKKTFIWLCQANYCLPLPEFVAMVNMSVKDGNINRKAIPMKAETFCRRLGPLLNLDRHVHPPEVNLSHATMEEYLQSDELERDPVLELRQLHVSPLDAQRFLAEECLRFLQMGDLRTPLAEGGGRVGDKNPFRDLHGGLYTTAGSENYGWVERMRERLRPPHGCVGLEYASINWPEHVRMAMYTPNEFRKRVIPILDDWFKAGDEAGDERYQSWQEAHAYFCSYDNCPCDKWQEPDVFLEEFGLLDLYRGACGLEPSEVVEEAAALTPIALSTLGGAAASCMGVAAKNAASVIKHRIGKHGTKPRQELVRRASEGGCSRRRGIGEHGESLAGGAELVEVQMGRLQNR